MYRWWECILGQAFGGAIWQHFAKLKMDILYDQSPSCRGSLAHLGDMYKTVSCNIICKCERFKSAYISIYRRTGKQPLLCSFIGVEYGRGKNELALSISKWMNPKGIWENKL